MKRHRVKVKYNYGGFSTLGSIIIDARTEKSAKTKALKIARKRVRQEKMEAANVTGCSLV